MAILIDGYNFLHVTGIFSPATGPSALPKLHAALLDFLATRLDPAEVSRTTVVFDAKGRRAGSRRTLEMSGITVHYAARHEEADTLLAELIEEFPAPKQLVVVSSDHQVQRAARRRRAKPVDSHVWYAELLRSHRRRQTTSRASPDVKPATPLAGHEAEWWLQQFSAELLAELEEELQARPDPSQAKGRRPSVRPDAAAPGSADSRSAGAPRPPALPTDSSDNPFPADYLEALQQEILRGELGGKRRRK